MNFKSVVFVCALLTAQSTAGASVQGAIDSHVKPTVVDGFDSTGLWILGAGSLATIVAHQFDQDMRNDWKNHQHMSRSTTRIGDVWGGGIPAVLILGTQTYFDREKGIAAVEGIVAGQVVVQSLKYSVRRQRPNEKEKVSFPSGHTQSSISLAMSMSKSYGWPKALPFWAMGVFTGLTRIADDQHWLSDVVAGATIGMFFGRAGFAHHLQPSVVFNDGRVDGGQLTAVYSW